nr:hypothetical protein GCM10020093_039650 [Planobispora longispora]
MARKVRERARLVAAAMLEASPDDLEWSVSEAGGRWSVQGSAEHGRTIQEIAMAAHSNLELPEGVEGHLDAVTVYNPPNLTYPFGAYVCVVDVDPGTGQVKVRRFVAVDDCGVRINPMIVEGQIHGGLADGIGMALMQLMAFDEDGNHLGASFMDYLLPTSMECPSWELGETVTPSPHHPVGAKGWGVGHGRLARRGGQRGARRAAPVRRPPRRHAAHPRQRVERPAGHADPDRPGGHMSEFLGMPERRPRAGREPYVMATVVRAGRPTSAKPGDRALVRADGTIEGFVGGHCATSAVRAQSLRLLRSGDSTLLRITPAAAEPYEEEGLVAVGQPCLSGGTLEIFLEAVLPPALVRVHGEGPIALALRRVGAALGYQVEPPPPAGPGHRRRGGGLARGRRGAGADGGPARGRAVRRAGGQPPPCRGRARRGRGRRAGARPGRARSGLPDAGRDRPVDLRPDRRGAPRDRAPAGLTIPGRAGGQMLLLTPGPGIA